MYPVELRTALNLSYQGACVCSLRVNVQILYNTIVKLVFLLDFVLGWFDYSVHAASVWFVVSWSPSSYPHGIHCESQFPYGTVIINLVGYPDSSNL